MARYAPEHKQATRRRMVETSARRFKRDGFDGTGISALVADAGLTNGAFYGHFRSKDELIATVVAEQLAVQVARVEEFPIEIGSGEALVRDYLSAEHRDDPGEGCPSAALLSEISRQDAATREAYANGAQALVAAVARHLDRGDETEARERAIGLYALLVSSMQLARAVTDPELSNQILASAYRNAMRIAGDETSARNPHQEIS